MTLRPQAIYTVPEDTARVARAAFPRGNSYLGMHDKLGRIYADHDFAALFPTRGQPRRMSKSARGTQSLGCDPRWQPR